MDFKEKRIRYISRDDEGFVKGFYDDSVGNVPEGLEPVTEELVEQLLHTVNMEGKRVKLINGVVEKYEYIVTPEMEIKKLNRYLDSTDWYVTRMIERTIDIPDDVKVKRLEAVNRINEIRG